MTKKTFAIFAFIIALAAPGFAQEMTPAELFKKVEAAYEALDTYKSMGTINSDIEAQGMNISTETWFSIIIKKPNLYVITWNQSNQMMPNMPQRGAVWNDGTGPYLYMGMMNAYSKMESDAMALASATGISGGVANTIPSLLLDSYGELMPGADMTLHLGMMMTDPKFEAEEKVGREDCYVIGGPSAMSKREAYWISKETFLIKRYYRSLEPPEGGFAMPEEAQMSEDDIKEALKGMGQKVTPEAIANMKKMMESSMDMLETMDLKGFSVETHPIISSPELSESDFAFALPEGAELKDSIFGDMMGGAGEMPDIGKIMEEMPDLQKMMEDMPELKKMMEGMPDGPNRRR